MKLQQFRLEEGCTAKGLSGSSRKQGVMDGVKAPP